MKEQKFVEFDYERYLKGDEVFFRSGNKVEENIYYSFAADARNEACFITVDRDGAILTYEKNGRILENEENAYDLVMKPKTRKVFIWISKNFKMNGLCYETTYAYLNKEDAASVIKDIYFKHAQVIELEIEVNE